MIRRLSCFFVIALIWILIFGWAAGLHWNAPLRPQQRVPMNASAFRVIMGAGVEDNTSLRVGAVGDDGNALQSIPLQRLKAADLSLLRYRFDGFPRTLELSFVFRRADAPEDVQTVTVPWPDEGWNSIDLSQIPEWHGEITELGFAEYATPQVAPESIAFKPFRFDAAELWSASWLGSFSALYTSWFNYTPWALLSISALGPQREVAQAPPMQPFLVLAVLLSVFALIWILGWPRQQLSALAIIASMTAWAVLDLRWLDDFHAKHLLAESIYSDKPWSERERLIPDQNIAQAADQVRSYFATQLPARHILVASDSSYVYLRLIYLMLPLDAAPMDMSVGLRFPQRDTRFVLFQSTQWHFDEEHGFLTGGNRSYAVEPVFESGELHIYRFKGARP